MNKLAGPDAAADQLEVVVDEITGFPLRVRELLRGRLLAERRIDRLRVDVPAPAPAFRLDVPARPAPMRLDYRFRRAAFGRAATITGYAPLAPARLPAGFARAQTRVAQLAGATGNEAANPISRDVVSTAYRRGLQLVVVTTRRRGRREPPCSPSASGSGPCWSDPLGAGEGIAVAEQPVRLRAGAIANSRARLVVAPLAIPHLWALTRELVVTVSGDLSRDELTAAAASLRVAR